MDEKELHKKNHTRQFWKIQDADISDNDWLSACQSDLSCLKDLLPQNSLCDDLIQNILRFTLGEEQFGPKHWKLSLARSIFYQLKPIIPRKLQLLFDKVYRSNLKIEGGLRWPIEDRYVTFQFELLKALMHQKELNQIKYIHFWPHSKRFAFVLTHDIETERGFKAIPEIVELEQKYGFRSLFNIVPERYPVDISYLDILRENGFEIGIHGLKHDGKLFRSQKEFQKRAKKINNYIRMYNASGFRAPLMHRHPVWMQSLECEYDMSFFDTDPYEGIPGGCMSIWPFFIGHFVELPYTLAQDHTLMMTLREKSSRLWMEKIDFIEKYCGMALLNSHPDYLIESDHLKIYETFLMEISGRKDGYWHAIPKEIALWWKARDTARIVQNSDSLSIHPNTMGAKIGTISVFADQLELRYKT